MQFDKDSVVSEIEKIRKEIGHDLVNVRIKELIYDENTNDLTIICPDRPDKSIIIGKGGWVVGRLKENLKLNNIHVVDNIDLMIKKNRLELSLERLEEFIIEMNNDEALINLKKLLNERLKNNFNFYEYTNKETESNLKVVVALSGGVDSSFSLILSKFLGFKTIAITVDPGTIILPNQFKRNIDNLTEELKVEHHYLPADYKKIINESLNGQYHPCGRCSKKIDDTILEYAKENNIQIAIFGDMLSTGYQSIVKRKGVNVINLPALLNIEKNEMKNIVREFNFKAIKGFGCPLLGEVEKKNPFMRKYSIQRVLRETRSGALEPGEALDLIWKK